jgi:hypothetical protein
MYCRKCYTELDAASESKRCPKCNRPFDPANPRSYLARPFPGPMKIIWHIAATTIVGFVAAWIVAFHQMANASGH